ncbi:MAG TPA: FAD-linked oxidase C-terminal domain-containing protein, partial [Kofleriaceae bacterium]|nr:FAD-linked oxidase C-terminal domain-containing protein [Kofleriaceae bacterium]
EAIRRVMQRGLRPAVVRLYDEVDTFVHSFGDDHGEDSSDWMRHAPSPDPGAGALPHLADANGAASKGGGWVGRVVGALGRRDGARPLRSLRRNLKQEALSAALSYPRVLNSIAGTLADRVSRKGCRLIIGIEGARIRTEVEASLVISELERAGARNLGEEPGRRWLEHRYSVSYKMSPMFRDGAFVDTMEVACTWERLLDLYEAVRAAIGQHAIVMAHFSHAYPEGCSIYFSFAGHGSSRRESEKIYDAVWRDGLAATTRVGGTISHHHGVGLLKAAYMTAEHREAMEIFRALKTSLDPDDIMNPGKLGLPVRSATR